MTRIDQARSRTAADRLLELAGPDLYRRNPFRITGLATDAGSREVRQRRQLVLNAIELGAPVAVGDGRLPLPRPPSADEVRAAFDALERDDLRLVHELFWWWGAPGACGCDERVHELHDIAVEEHAKALDLEADGTDVSREARFEQWDDAADSWLEALEEEKGLWDHMRHRLRGFSDRSLDESTVTGLRKALPNALLRPQVALVRRSDASAELAGLLDRWDLDAAVIEDARVSAAGPSYERIATRVREISTLADAELAARRAADELPAAANLLETLLPHERFRRSAKLRNDIAVTMFNCAVQLPDPRAALKLVLTLVEHAAELAVNREDRQAIRADLAVVRASSSLRRPPPQPWIWPANLALCLGVIAGIAHLLVGQWHAPILVAVGSSVVLAPFAFRIIYSGRYRMVVARHAWVGVVACLGVGVAIVNLDAWGFVAFLWCLFAFVIAIPVTRGIGASWANRRSSR